MTGMSTAPIWYTAEQLCALLSVKNPATIFRWARAGKIPPPRRMGYRTSRWRADEMAVVLAEGAQAPGTYAGEPGGAAKRRPKKARPPAKG